MFTPKLSDSRSLNKNIKTLLEVPYIYVSILKNNIYLSLSIKAEYYMLSVLIPVYNVDVRGLVEDIVKQGQKAGIPFEVIVLDDCSKDLYKTNNQLLSNTEKVHYAELDENIGRSKIRNKLADMANYAHLLFMDCDTALPDDQYIQRYISCCNEKNIICGGRIYRKNPPTEHNKYFRWYYGSKRETSNAEKRNKNPNKSFLSNNFLISRSLFQKVRFNENITSYGHEDTLFGYELEKKGVVIVHIDNPLIHNGLETTAEFLSKTRDAMGNLRFIYNAYREETNLIKNIKILKTYNRINKIGMVKPMSFFYRIAHKMLENNLKSRRPSLLVFDLYKLGFLCLIT